MQLHHRRSIRLSGYDYSQNGLYFITICTRNKERLFGEVHNNQVILSEIGKVVESCWLEIPQHYPQIVLHAFVVMPNHIHGIIEIKNNVGANDVCDAVANETGNVVANYSGNVVVNETGNVVTNETGNVVANETGNVGANNYSPLPSPSPAVSASPSPAVSASPSPAVSVSPSPAVSASPSPDTGHSRPVGTSRTIGSVVRGFKIGVTKRIGFSPWQRNYYERIIRNEIAYQKITQYIENNPIRWKEDRFFDERS